MTVRLAARPRLVELMIARWSQRAVLLIAGPGFGKSVLLAQAVDENALSPRGVDIIVRCTAADSSPAHLLRHIGEDIGVECATSEGSVLLDSLFAELGRRWPLGVCLVIDDAHHICGSDKGARLLGQLVCDAPSSVHFVVASHTRVRGLAQLRLAGALAEIGEDQLRFSEPELAELADLHGVDTSTPAATGGWPAGAAMAAAYDIRGAEEYVFETILDRLDAQTRYVLAVAAAIGGGDDDLLRRSVGNPAIDVTGLLSQLPLVTMTSTGEFVVHDLWLRVVKQVAGHRDVVDAVARAVHVMVERSQFDRGFRLCVAHGDWAGAAGVLTSCCRHGHVEVLPDVLAEWLAELPPSRRDEPEGLLLRGLVGRVNDPFDDQTTELLERAVNGYRAIGNVVGEVAAGVELVYVLRNQGRCATMPAFLARAVELAGAGHIEAAGPAAVGRALLAEATGDDHQMLATLARVPPDLLSRDWQAVVAFRQAIAHLTLGNEREMLEAAERCARLSGNSSDRHVLALGRWFAGDPSLAHATCDKISADAARSRVDSVLLGTMATMVLATAGRIDEAATQLAATDQAATGQMSALLRGSLVGVRALLAVSKGDEDRAQAILEASLAEHPLKSTMGWRMAARWLPLAYVLVPTVRDELDHRELGALHERRLAVARAVTAVREGSPQLTTSASITPQAVATAVPLPWAMTLAIGLADDGGSHGRQIAEYLLELYGEPAKEALRCSTSHPSRRVANSARKLLGQITVAPRHNVQLEVLGPLVLRVGTDDVVHSHWNRDRVRSLLLYLMLHGPAHREQVIDALWPHLDLGAADRNLRVTLTYLNQVLEPGRRQGEAPFFIRQSGSRLALADGPQLHVDLIEFESLLRLAEDADGRGLPSVALQHFERALALWRGPCMSDVVYEDWAQAACHSVTARYVAGALRTAEIYLAGGRASRAEDCARLALAADAWSERAHRTLVAAALARGDRSAAARALAHCDAMLAGFGVAADPETEMLRRRLQSGAAACTSAEMLPQRNERVPA